MQRSNHLMDLSIASRILSASGDVVAITSSSCIIMSEPMVFWRDMECSGVSSLGVCQYQGASAGDSEISLTLVSHHADLKSVHRLR